ncbi:flagellar assembly factor FliW [Clostridia bacterium]|nr:flagellar assembly factor FliW [Clostridia bacterium]GHU74629.1 flagellar assembly factor FliW [Clostridia bacterium]
MTITTKNFGELEIDESQTILFLEGLPGFSEYKNFVLLDNDDDTPFCYLQSVDDGELAFILMDAFQKYTDYAPEIDPSDISTLGEYTDETKSDFLIYNVVVLPQDVKKMSVNLLAPVIINQKLRKGQQVIARNADQKAYTVHHLVFDEGDITC